MTQKPKKQLFNRYLLFLALLFIPLLGFFVYASYQNSFYIVVAFTFFIIILALIPFHHRIVQKRAKSDLEEQDYVEKINLLQAEIKKEESIVNALHRKILNYSQLKGLTERLSMCLSLEDTSDTLSEEVGKIFEDKDNTIIFYLFHSGTGELGISSAHRGEMQVNIKSKKGDVFDEWIVKTMQPLLVEDARNDFRFDIEKIGFKEQRPVRSLISVPLMVGGKALGILRVDSQRPDVFSTEDLRFLTTIGELSAVAVENAQLYDRVEDLAIRDSLTGLYLRRYLLERMTSEIGRQMRRKGEMSFLMIDLDKFKQYNDKFGHMAGDIVLKAVGKILSQAFDDPGTFLCRYGGEEFSVLIPDCPKKKAMSMAEDVRKEIEKQMIILRRKKTKITVSIGVATFPKDAQVKEELIHKADHALYEAKRKGRNCVVASE